MARGAIKGVKNIPTHFKNAINFVKTADEHEEFLKESGISQKEEGAFKTAMLFIADDKHDKYDDQQGRYDAAGAGHVEIKQLEPLLFQPANDDTGH